MVLYIEDNPDHAELVVETLAEHTAQPVVLAPDGAAGLDVLGREPLPRLVLLDLRLPKIDGLTVLRTLRAMEPTRMVPVVVLTTSAAERDVKAAYAAGANAYLVKPTRYEELDGVLAAVASFWLGANRLAGDVP